MLPLLGIELVFPEIQVQSEPVLSLFDVNLPSTLLCSALHHVLTGTYQDFASTSSGHNQRADSEG